MQRLSWESAWIRRPGAFDRWGRDRTDEPAIVTVESETLEFGADSEPESYSVDYGEDGEVTITGFTAAPPPVTRSRTMTSNPSIVARSCSWSSNETSGCVRRTSPTSRIRSNWSTMTTARTCSLTFPTLQARSSGETREEWSDRSVLVESARGIGRADWLVGDQMTSSKSWWPWMSTPSSVISQRKTPLPDPVSRSAADLMPRAAIVVASSFERSSS